MRKFKVKDNLDIVLASAGAFLSLILCCYLYIAVGQWLYVSIGILVFLACVGYLLIRRRQELVPLAYESTRLSGILGISFIALFISSICVYVFRPEAYERPLAFFILTALAGGVLAARIVCMPITKKNVVTTLVGVVLVGLSLEWTVTLLYPSIIGLDPWSYFWTWEQIVNEGYVNYQTHPLMHLIVAGTSMATGLGYKMATMASISLITVVADAILICLIGRMIVNVRVGLLGALLVVTSSWHIFFGYWTIPNTFGLTVMLGAVYLALKYYNGMSRVVLLSLVVCMMALLFTHPIASLWLVILLVAFPLGMLIWRWLGGKRVSLRPLLVVLVLYIIMLLPWWTFGAGLTKHMGLMLGQGLSPVTLGLTVAPGIESVGPDIEPIIVEPVEPIEPEPVEPIEPEPVEPIEPEPVEPVTEIEGSTYTEVGVGKSFGETMFNCAGMFLFFTMAIVGCFIMVSKRHMGWRSIAWVGAGIAVLAIGFFPMLFGISVIEHRWWFLAEVLLSIPLAVVLIGIPRMKELFVGYVVGVLIFLMALGLPTNMDNRTFSPNQIVRYALTSDEIEAVDEVMSQYDGVVGVDGFYGLTRIIYPEYADRILSITDHILDASFDECDADIILIRDEIVNQPIGLGDGKIYRLNYDPIQLLIMQGWTVIYESEEVIGLKKLGE